MKTSLELIKDPKALQCVKKCSLEKKINIKLSITKTSALVSG